MANTKTGPNFYVDTDGEQLTFDKTKVAYIIFTPSATNDELILSNSAAGPIILQIQSSQGKETKMIDTSRRPMLFPNGIYIDTLSSGAVATIITTQGNDI